MDPRAWIAIGIMASASRSPAPREPAPIFCLSECPTPGAGLGELARMRELLRASSATSSHWQYASTAPNVGPFLP